MKNFQLTKTNPILFAIIALILFGLVVIIIITSGNLSNKDANNQSYQQSATVNSVVQNTLAPNEFESVDIPVSEGSIDNVADIDISFRDISFTDTVESVVAKEKKSDDISSEPEIISATDNYSYVIYSSNPNNPLKYENCAVSGSDPNSGITYVFVNNVLEEIRFQFGYQNQASNNSIRDMLTKKYGLPTFTRTTDILSEYWWKSKDLTLILTLDKTTTNISITRTAN